MNPLVLDALLYSKLTKTLKGCQEFESPEGIRALFVGELEPYRTSLTFSARSSIDDYIEASVDLLRKRKIKNGPYLLPVVIDVLIEKYAHDEISNDLQACKSGIQQIIHDTEAADQAKPSGAEAASPQSYLTQLTQCMVSCFDEYELAVLCADISDAVRTQFGYLDYEDLRGQSVEEKATALVSYCNRRSLAIHLVTVCQQTRPDIDWPDPAQFLSWQRAQSTEAEQERLARLIADYFDDDDFRILCFDLDVETDLFSDVNRTIQARKLIQSFAKRNRWHLVRSICIQDWPNIAWPEQISVLHMQQNAPFIFSQKQIVRRKLRQRLHDYFTNDELRELCFLTGADLDLFSKPTLAPRNIFAIQIIEYYEMNSEMDRLTAGCRNARPAQNWDDIAVNVSPQEPFDPRRERLIERYKLLVKSLDTRLLEQLMVDLKVPLNIRRRDIGTLDLILYCDQKHRTPNLLTACKKLLPDVAWI